MNTRKRMGDRKDPCGPPLLIDLEEDHWMSTTGAIVHKRKFEIKEQKEA